MKVISVEQARFRRWDKKQEKKYTLALKMERKRKEVLSVLSSSSHMGRA